MLLETNWTNEVYNSESNSVIHTFTLPYNISCKKGGIVNTWDYEVGNNADISKFLCL